MKLELAARRLPVRICNRAAVAAARASFVSSPHADPCDVIERQTVDSQLRLELREQLARRTIRRRSSRACADDFGKLPPQPGKTFRFHSCRP
jgi:hypothetical protein